MERIKSQNNPNVEWEYRFEKIGTDSPVAVMYYKGRKALALYEERMGHKALVDYEYRFINTYCSIFVLYNDEQMICERNNKNSDNAEENAKDRLIAGCNVVEKKFTEIIEEIRAVI